MTAGSKRSSSGPSRRARVASRTSCTMRRASRVEDAHAVGVGVHDEEPWRRRGSIAHRARVRPAAARVRPVDERAAGRRSEGAREPRRTQQASRALMAAARREREGDRVGERRRAAAAEISGTQSCSRSVVTTRSDAPRRAVSVASPISPVSVRSAICRPPEAERLPIGPGAEVRALVGPARRAGPGRGRPSR